MLKTNTKLAATLSIAFAGALALTGSAASASTTTTPNLVGNGCASYIANNPTGPSSIADMENQTAAEAIANNPLLTTYNEAISGQFNSDVDLTQTLSNGEFTIFAPVDSAFDDLDAATLSNLHTDSNFLITTIIYNIIPGNVSPDDIVGTKTTIQGSDITISGTGNNLVVNNEANIICGGIKTENATIYLVDSVLFPPVAPEETEE